MPLKQYHWPTLCQCFGQSTEAGTAHFMALGLHIVALNATALLVHCYAMHHVILT
jgi:hypothetical protein